MAAKRRRIEPIIKPVPTVRVAVADGTADGARAGLVDNVDTVSATVPAWDALRLTIKAQVERS